jgi:hypothetical protein
MIRVGQLPFAEIKPGGLILTKELFPPKCRLVRRRTTLKQSPKSTKLSR